MKKFIVKTLLLALFLSLFITKISFAGECVKGIKRIQASKSLDLLWLHFTDNTKAYALVGQGDSAEGIDRVLSIALTAKLTGKNVILHVNDGISCDTNFQRNWEYLSLE